MNGGVCLPLAAGSELRWKGPQQLESACSRFLGGTKKGGAPADKARIWVGCASFLSRTSHPRSHPVGKGDRGGPMAVPSEAEQMEYLRTNADSDLAFLWAESEVPLLIQYRVAVAGFRTVPRFSNLADDRAALRAALREDFQIDPAVGGAADRSTAAAIISLRATTRRALWLARPTAQRG